MLTDAFIWNAAVVASSATDDNIANTAVATMGMVATTARNNKKGSRCRRIRRNISSQYLFWGHSSTLCE